MRILVVGAGAVGGYLAAMLGAAGRDVTLLLRPARAASYGGTLTVRAEGEERRVPLRAATRATVMPAHDLVILACKAWDLDDAMEDIAAALAPAGAVLPLLNGLAHVGALNDRFGSGSVLGGTARIQARVAADGTIERLNDWRTITFGEQAGGESARTAAIHRLLDVPGVIAAPSAAVMGAMWEKFVHLATAAAATCLMRASVGEIVRAEGGAAFLAGLLETAARVATAHGNPPSAAFMETYRAVFSDPGSAYVTSMARDLERGARTEAEHILGHMVRLAEGAGTDPGAFRLARLHMLAYDERRAAARLPPPMP
ncbi:MAG: 2-dehydropantoate 2-reductase [Acetobacteraceae bacterium]|jgi:2-dehydropantoate 2-reductase|nr:2-dehydropantoate 2-reductase [Acetobacteraceae bacterium]